MNISKVRICSFVLSCLAAVGILLSTAAQAHEDEGDEVSDRLTGGGYVMGTPTGAKGTFAIGGGIKNGAPWGHLNFIDHGSGMHVKAILIFSYTAINQNERRIQGHCTINGEGEHGFTVFAADNGEPGSGDSFHLYLQDGYHAGGAVKGGNIQLHKK